MKVFKKLKVEQIVFLSFLVFFLTTFSAIEIFGESVDTGYADIEEIVTSL